MPSTLAACRKCTWHNRIQLFPLSVATGRGGVKRPTAGAPYAPTTGAAKGREETYSRCFEKNENRFPPLPLLRSWSVRRAPPWWASYPHTPPRPTPGVPAGGRELSVRTACRMGCDEKKAEVLRHLRLFSRRTPNRQRKRTDKKFSLLPSAPPSIRISSLGLLAANTVPAPVGGDRSAAFAVKQESSPLPGHHRHGPFGAAGGF